MANGNCSINKPLGMVNGGSPTENLEHAPRMKRNGPKKSRARSSIQAAQSCALRPNLVDDNSSIPQQHQHHVQQLRKNGDFMPRLYQKKKTPDFINDQNGDGRLLQKLHLRYRIRDTHATGWRRNTIWVSQRIGLRWSNRFWKQ